MPQPKLKVEILEAYRNAGSGDKNYVVLIKNESGQQLCPTKIITTHPGSGVLRETDGTGCLPTNSRWLEDALQWAVDTAMKLTLDMHPVIQMSLAAGQGKP